MRTNELFHSSVRHEDVIHHPLVTGAVDAADGTRPLPPISFQVRQQVQSVFVGRLGEFQEADAASFFPGSRQGLMLDFYQADLR